MKVFSLSSGLALFAGLALCSLAAAAVQPRETLLVTPSLGGGAVFQDAPLKPGALEGSPGQALDTSRATAIHSLAEFRRNGGFCNYSTDIVVAPGSREVAVFTLGLSGRNDGKGLVGAAGSVLDAKGEPTPGALFQAVQLGDAAPDQANSNLSVGDAYFLPHGEGFLFGDWGSSKVGSSRVRRGAVCVLLDEGNGPLEFWAMDSLDGPKALKVQPPEGEWKVPMSFLDFPEGGLCAWSLGEENDVRIAIVLAKEDAGVAEYSLFVWNKGRWSMKSLFRDGGRDIRALGVVKVEIRLAWVEDRFEALVSLAEPSMPARLKRFNWELGLLDLTTPTPEAGMEKRDSFHIVPNGFIAPGADLSDPFTVIHCNGPGFANQDPLRETVSDSTPVLSVSLGPLAAVNSLGIRLAPYPNGHSSRIGHRVHSVLRWGETAGPVRGSLCGTATFWGCVGSLKPGPDLLEIPAMQRLPYMSLQFLSSYSIVREGNKSSLLLAPNLFYGDVREGPSRDPLTWMRIDHEEGTVTMDSLPTDRFMSDTARWVK